MALLYRFHLSQACYRSEYTQTYVAYITRSPTPGTKDVHENRGSTLFMQLYMDKENCRIPTPFFQTITSLTATTRILREFSRLCQACLLYTSRCV